MHLDRLNFYRLSIILATALFATMLVSSISSCSLSYYHQAVSGHLSILKQRESIQDILASDSDTLSEVQRNKLRLILDIREMAENALALPVENGYSSYVDIGREFVVWNVFAAPEFSVSPQQWCYPIIGCASYRGYYSENAAHAYTKKLAEKDLETFVGGVRAYSTLGWFNDPVLSTFLSQNDLSIVALLVHEISHKIMYAKNDTAFNESFATAVELFGVEVWLHQHRGTIPQQTIEEFYKRRRIRSDFIQLVLETRNELDMIYISDLADEEKRKAKSRIFKKLKSDLVKLDADYGYQALYSPWSNDLNNAKIAPVNSYHQWVNAIRSRLDKTLAQSNCNTTTLGLDKSQEKDNSLGIDNCQQPLKAFYAEMKSLAKLDTEKRRLILEDWQALASQAPLTEAENDLE